MGLARISEEELCEYKIETFQLISCAYIFLAKKKQSHQVVT